MPRKPADVFRKNVARILFERSMTQAELALLIGTKSPNISRILSGQDRHALGYQPVAPLSGETCHGCTADTFCGTEVSYPISETDGTAHEA